MAVKFLRTEYPFIYLMRVHLDVGKKAMIVYLLLAVENGARSLCLISTLYKGGIGQQRQPLKECVSKR